MPQNNTQLNAVEVGMDLSGDKLEVLKQSLIDGARSGARMRIEPLPAPALEALHVLVDFEQVGTAGPFPVVGGRVKLPTETMLDLARMLKPTADTLAAPAAVAGPVMASIPHELLVRAVNSLGSFVSGEGWAKSDMDTLDDLCAAMPAADLSAELNHSPAAPAPEAPVAPATPVQVQALRRARRALYAIGKTYDDSELRARALEADEEIGRLLAAAHHAPAAPSEAPEQGSRAALLQLAEVLESGMSLLHAERKEAAHALRLQAAAAPDAPAVDALEEARRTVAAIGIVGHYNEQDVILRTSVLGMLDRRIAEARAAAKGA